MQEDNDYEGKQPRNQERQLHRPAGPCPSVQEPYSRRVGVLACGESPADGTVAHVGHQSAIPHLAPLERDQTAETHKYSVSLQLMSHVYIYLDDINIFVQHFHRGHKLNA
jgi:hypothetical protein